MVVCYIWLVTVTNLCHSNKFSLSNQQITFYSVGEQPSRATAHMLSGSRPCKQKFCTKF